MADFRAVCSLKIFSEKELYSKRTCEKEILQMQLVEPMLLGLHDSSGRYCQRLIMPFIPRFLAGISIHMIPILRNDRSLYKTPKPPL